ncbi:hypothetical protein PCNPT3_00825 [Psychromonas sp. CNPT3]|uniref:tight adherence pilus pseudopilin TadF n=1 Tax=Psychromonas sp. CNPT3 TaxID=314282 RepID=UPI00006E70AA|nr:tight adherence pilus pseudopilin TadF [Psychromonas sp. CNPT3]AGH80107.1 hypothetical protein PCNPT3_00825 [Psychromonas sp. CNPT3]
MKTLFNLSHQQRGSSIIALPIISLIIIVLILFCVKINVALSLKAKLDRLSYALTNIVVNEPFNLDLVGKNDWIQQAMSDDLLRIAENQFVTQGNDQIIVGLQLAQLKRLQTNGATKVRVLQSGPSCQPNTRLAELKALSPLGNTKEVNSQKYADLFQVTVCLSNMTTLDLPWGEVGLAKFNDNFYKSASLLIGRAL